jgi:hypothetical protein
MEDYEARMLRVYSDFLDELDDDRPVDEVDWEEVALRRKEAKENG